MSHWAEGRSRDGAGSTDRRTFRKNPLRTYSVALKWKTFRRLKFRIAKTAEAYLATEASGSGAPTRSHLSKLNFREGGYPPLPRLMCGHTAPRRLRRLKWQVDVKIGGSLATGPGSPTRQA